jgi:hypothetical protein
MGNDTCSCYTFASSLAEIGVLASSLAVPLLMTPATNRAINDCSRRQPQLDLIVDSTYSLNGLTSNAQVRDVWCHSAIYLEGLGLGYPRPAIFDHLATIPLDYELDNHL